MSLRKQTLLIIGSAFGFLALLLFGSVYFILLENYRQLEQDSIEVDTQRILNAIDGEIEQLNATTADWAYWDDTYQFVQDGNVKYIEMNLSPEALANLGLDLVVFINQSGEVGYQLAIEPETGKELLFPEDFYRYLTAGSLLLDHPDADHVVSGMVNSSLGPLLVAARPILTSLRQGPSQGVLVFARYLDEASVQELSSALNTSFSIYPIGAEELPADVVEAQASLTQNPAIMTRALDSSQAAGYGLVKDISGQPAVIIKGEFPRQIYRQGLQSTFYFVLWIVLLGVVLTLVLVTLLEKVVISRVRDLQMSVMRVQTTQNLATTIPVRGKDELAGLAGGIQGMLAELSRSRRELELANQRLEQRVSERTQELVQANQQLLEEIAERQQAQLESAQARDQALDALRLKTQILANISHDARTPLNVIMLRTDLLEAEMPGKLNARQKEMMTSIRNCSRQLLDFMNNLLEEARISTGKLILRKEIVSPRELVQRSVDALGPLVQRKALELRVSISEDVPSSLEGDPLRLEQILNNLVGNAIKFTEQGYIAIDVYCPDEAHWAMVVADTGSGVEPSHRERIFEPFWQLDGSITRKETRGVGLGLAIVKQLTTLMGGTAKVGANPESETGSVFTVTLPLIAVEESMPGLDDRSTASEGR